MVYGFESYTPFYLFIFHFLLLFKLFRVQMSNFKPQNSIISMVSQGHFLSGVDHGGTGGTPPQNFGWGDRNVVCPPPTFGQAHS